MKIMIVAAAFCILSPQAWAFEVSAQEHSCGGDSGIQYLETDIQGQIATKAFQSCNGQAVRQISAVKFDAKRVDDGNCEAFDELVSGTGEFECVPASFIIFGDNTTPGDPSNNIMADHGTFEVTAISDTTLTGTLSGGLGFMNTEVSGEFSVPLCK